MFGRYAIVLAVATLLIGSVCTSALAQEDAEAIVREIYDRYTLSTETGDVDLHMSFWDDNGIKMSPDAPAIIEAVKNWGASGVMSVGRVF